MGYEVKTGDALALLKGIPSESVQTCITSPPYFGLRDYGTAEWEGGDDEGCDHKGEPMRTRANINRNCGTGADVKNAEGRQFFRQTCGRCGATRVDNQIGLEETPEAYVAKLVEVFREVRRVLKDDGVLWLNLASSYAGGGRGNYCSDVSKQKTNVGANIPAVKVLGADEPFALRDDLTVDELAYVLSELGAHFSKGGEVGQPDFAVGVDEAVTSLAGGE
jgi:DNA modification methylase